MSQKYGSGLALLWLCQLELLSHHRDQSEYQPSLGLELWQGLTPTDPADPTVAVGRVGAADADAADAAGVANADEAGVTGVANDAEADAATGEVSALD